MVPVVPAGIPSPYPMTSSSAVSSLPSRPAQEVILLALFSVSFKKMEVTNGQATSAPPGRFCLAHAKN